MLHQHKVNCYIKYCFALHFFKNATFESDVTALLMNKFVLQPGIDCCLFYVGDIIYGREKAFKSMGKVGKKPCYIRFFFKEQLMYMPIGHWFYFTEWFKNNEPKTSWVCFKKLAKLSFISKLSFVFLNLPSKAKCISVYIKISTYCYTSQLFLCKLKFWDPCFMDNQNKFFSCGNGQLSMFGLAGF